MHYIYFGIEKNTRGVSEDLVWDVSDYERIQEEDLPVSLITHSYIFKF